MEQEKRRNTAIAVGGIGGLIALLFFLRRTEAAPEDIIHGHVIAAEPPEGPVAGATVEIVDIASTTTNAQGYFKFTGVPEGLHLVRVTHEDRQTWEYQIYLWYGELIEIRMYPLFAELTGVVTDIETGDPIDSVVVSVDEGMHMTGTNDKGEYRLRHIIPGTYHVSFRDSKDRYATVEFPSVYIPLEGAVLNAQMESVAPGAIAVSTSPVVANASVIVYKFVPEWGWVIDVEGKTDSNGECFFDGIGAGERRIVVRHIDYDPAQRTITVYPGETTEVTISLQEATTVNFLRPSWREKGTLAEIWLQPGTTISIYDAGTNELVLSHTLEYANRSVYLKDFPLGYHYLHLDPITEPGEPQYHSLTTTTFFVARSGPKQHYDWGEVWPGHPECAVRLRLEKK